MIVDTLVHMARYKGLHPNLDRGFDFLRKAASGGLPDGRYAVDEARVYAQVSSYRTQSAASKCLEAHRKYIDIQYLFLGNETLYWTPLERCTVKEEYSESEDIVLLAGADETAIVLQNGLFVVLFPPDAHKPGCVWQSQEEVRKLVIKASIL